MMDLKEHTIEALRAMLFVETEAHQQARSEAGILIGDAYWRAQATVDEIGARIDALEQEIADRDA